MTMRRPSRNLRGALAVLAVAAAWPTAAVAQLRYEREYPAVRYTDGPADDPIATLFERVERGEITLAHDDERGYLDALLDGLGIAPESQVLVFTGTSFQGNLIVPERPRAIYFDDDSYVGWVQGADAMELSAIDPVKGGVFYSLSQDPAETPRPTSEPDLCLQCHDSYSLSGGGTPRHFVGSMLPDENGRSVFHEGWQLTDDRTPFTRRWGGWYVTGTHGELTHRGNVVVEAPATPADIDFGSTGNLTSLDGKFDTSPYPTPHSDIVALMVLEHQVRAQNAITRFGYDVRTALAEIESGASVSSGADAGGAEVPARLAEVFERSGEVLVDALLFVDEAELGGPIRGTSGYAETFTARGVEDSRGRSLRDFDLETRTFRYPVSYMVRSRGFTGLPDAARAFVYRRLREVLDGTDRSARFDHLTEADRTAALEILRETLPELFDPA